MKEVQKVIVTSHKPEEEGSKLWLHSNALKQCLSNTVLRFNDTQRVSIKTIAGSVLISETAYASAMHTANLEAEVQKTACHPTAALQLRMTTTAPCFARALQLATAAALAVVSE
eukprot:4301-Heterococcus_DN1.PRE.3